MAKNIMDKKNMAMTRRIQKQQLQMECAQILHEEDIQQDEEEYMAYFPCNPLHEEEYLEKNEEDEEGEDWLSEEDLYFLLFG